MDAERKQSSVRSIPDKTSTGTRRVARRSVAGTRGEGATPPPEYETEPHRGKLRKRKIPSPPSPPRVKVEETEEGKRWLGPGEVELHGDVLEVRDGYGKIVDSVVVPSKEEDKNKPSRGKEK